MGMSLHADLLDRWTKLAGPGAPAVGEALVRRYSEPHRRYHTVEHLAAMLAVIDDLAADAADLDAVRYAAFFHDAVYAMDGGDNEEASARLAETTLPAMGVAPETVAEVAAWSASPAVTTPTRPTATVPSCATPTSRSWPPHRRSMPPIPPPSAPNTPTCRTICSGPAGPRCWAPWPISLPCSAPPPAALATRTRRGRISPPNSPRSPPDQRVPYL